MMIVIGLLTVILVLDCLLLMLLVLVQLPKKEAGIGQAFGGAATDALFGAGSGNALTKMTKYATGAFFILTLAISIMFNVHKRNEGSGFERSLSRNPEAAAPVVPAKNLPTPVGAASTTPAPGANGAAAPVNPPGNAAAGNNATAPATTTPQPTTTAPAPAPASTPATK